jgi:hypothetical protein
MVDITLLKEQVIVFSCVAVIMKMLFVYYDYEQSAQKVALYILHVFGCGANSILVLFCSGHI